MRNPYGHCYWDVDYPTPEDDAPDPMESDKAMEEYIERRRMEFCEEWFQYIEDNE